MIPNGFLALLAFRHPQADVARLAVRVSLIHREADVVLRARRKRTIACERTRRRAWVCRREERVPALGAEEVLLVVSPLPQLRVVQRDEPLVDDRRLAVVAPRRELLRTINMVNSGAAYASKDDEPHGSPGGSTAARHAHTNSGSPAARHTHSTGSNPDATACPSRSRSVQ